MKNMIMEISIRNHGKIQINLFPSLAPLAIRSLLSFIDSHAYDGKAIEKIESDFVIQPIFYDEGIFAGSNKPEFKTIKENHNYQFHYGTVAMAGDNNSSSSSQFFVTLKPKEYLNGNFTVIGEVIDGFEEIERLNHIELIEKIDEATGFKYHQPKNIEIVETIKIID